MADRAEAHLDKVDASHLPMTFLPGAGIRLIVAATHSSD
jgi:hypothetical protein